MSVRLPPLDGHRPPLQLAAINHAKDHGDLATLRRIAEEPHGFILRRGWTALDFGEERGSRNCAGWGRASSWKSSACGAEFAQRCRRGEGARLEMGRIRPPT